ncbi:unnamed protein product, partial [marine sediment metagenome]
MPVIRKVTDPAKIVTDEQVLKFLAKRGVDKDYVEFWHDYNAQHPNAKFYRDLKSNNLIGVFTSLIRVNEDNVKIEPQWIKQGDDYVSSPNLFACRVSGKKVEFSAGKQIVWEPQLFLNGIEQFCGKAKILLVDPFNENYHGNVLEWDYGICKRWLRIIPGYLFERWIFQSNPQGEVRIKHNCIGDMQLGFGGARDGRWFDLEATVTSDEEII